MLQELVGRRSEISARWEALLRIERVNTPLANPDALVHMFDWTLDEVFAVLRGSSAITEDAAPFATTAISLPSCLCGRNPYVAYFKAAKQAMMEALILVQSETMLLDPGERDAAANELRETLNQLWQREVTAFCALCTHRNELPSEVGDPRKLGA